MMQGIRAGLPSGRQPAPRPSNAAIAHAMGRNATGFVPANLRADFTAAIFAKNFHSDGIEPILHAATSGFVLQRLYIL